MFRKSLFAATIAFCLLSSAFADSFTDQANVLFQSIYNRSNGNFSVQRTEFENALSLTRNQGLSTSFSSNARTLLQQVLQGEVLRTSGNTPSGWNFGSFDGVCGTSAGLIHWATPTQNLCSAGVATSVFGDDNWLWACQGQGVYGKTVFCSAQKTQQVSYNTFSQNGSCGLASGQNLTSRPWYNLCASGVASSVNGNGPWYWTCQGLNGGASQTCSTTNISLSCNATNMGGAYLPQTTDGTSRTVQSAYNNMLVTYICENGSWRQQGSSVQASSQGSCGWANGKSFYQAPVNDLCAGGNASNVSWNQDGWTWSCIGTNSTHALCSAFQEKNYNNSYSSPYYNGYYSNTYRGNRFYNVDTTPYWYNNGYSNSYWNYTDTPACGSAAGTRYSASPIGDLCDRGIPSGVTDNGSNWSWKCYDRSNENRYASCSATNTSYRSNSGNHWRNNASEGNIWHPSTSSNPSSDNIWHPSTSSTRRSYNDQNAACGSANNVYFTSRPQDSQLCASGQPYGVTGAGPWYWNCQGVGTGWSKSCNTLHR